MSQQRIERHNIHNLVFRDADMKDNKKRKNDN